MNHKHRQRKTRTKGAAAAEFAICLPPLILLVLASIEACNAIFLDQGTLIGAYEGARIAVKPDSTSTLVRDKCNEALNGRGIQSAIVTLTPEDIRTARRGENVSITVSAPCDKNSVLPRWFFAGRSVSSTVTMVKE